VVDSLWISSSPSVLSCSLIRLLLSVMEGTLS
jgi:hypothetical protein